jgi:hypothetical protein
LTFPQHLQDVLIPNSRNVHNNLQQIHDGGEEQMAYKVGGDDAYVSNGKLEEVMHCLETLEPKFIHVATFPCEQNPIS